MATLREQIEGIIEEFKSLQTNPASYRDKNDAFPLPRMIDAGNGGSIIVSRKIDNAILAASGQLMRADPTLARKFTLTEWKALARRAFGPALAMIDLDVDPAKNADTVLTKIRTALGKQVSGHGVLEFAFGCTLFGNAAVQPFIIGPVRYESRLDWLARKRHDGAVSPVTSRRVEQAWSGKRLHKRKPSHDSIGETDILEAVCSCPFVCSIATSGLAAEAGREKALTAARLATAAIALLWLNPSSVLDGMNLIIDRRLHSQKVLTYIPGKIVLAGWRLSHLPHGPWMENGEWEREFAKYSDHFGVAGKLLEYMVSPTGNVPQLKMMNTLAQALLWFHEGCRETVTLMAIVKYSAALEALACGGKSDGIRRLINARLGIQDNSPIRPNGPTLKQAIDEIYSDGRSRTVHGTNSKLGHDWTEVRGLAEQFTRLCLIACFEWAAKNPSSDSPSQLSQ